MQGAVLRVMTYKDTMQRFYCDWSVTIGCEIKKNSPDVAVIVCLYLVLGTRG